MPPYLAHTRTGSGPPLVLLHPLGADRQVWDEVAAQLAPNREILAVDLPGFGASPRLAETPTPAALARAVAGLLAGEGVERPDVAGNSLGGWVALELALVSGVSSVTAIAPAGLWPEPLAPRVGAGRLLGRLGLPLVAVATLTPTGRRLLLSGSVARPERVAPRAAAHLIRAYATAPDFQRVNAAMRAGRFTRLAEITAPVTLVWPEHDGRVSRPRDLPPQIESIALPGAGHIPMLDQPEAVAALLQRTARATASPRSARRRAAR